MGTPSGIRTQFKMLVGKGGLEAPGVHSKKSSILDCFKVGNDCDSACLLTFVVAAGSAAVAVCGWCHGIIAANSFLLRKIYMLKFTGYR